MNWEQKTEMSSFLNSRKYSEATKLFYDNLETADEQAFFMFMSGIELTEEVINKDIDLHRKILEKCNTIPTDSFMSALRYALYDNLIEKYK